MIKASFVIVTRNRSELLKGCLASLSNIIDSSYEIIVVDNGSTDETLKQLKKNQLRAGNFQLIENSQNLGVAAARNQGAQMAQGHYIIFLDDDTLMAPDTSFGKIIDFMDSNKKIAVVGPKILYPNGKIQESYRRFPSLPAIIWRGTPLHKIIPQARFYRNYILADANPNDLMSVDWVIGACQVINRDAFVKLGPLDNKYFFGWEDLDFCFKVKMSGYYVVYFPDTQVLHYYQRESAKGIISIAKLQHVKSITRFFIKAYFG
ncbi:MAG: glycosyltransferase family 2 protein [Patescibacteria group bacterium]